MTSLLASPRDNEWSSFAIITQALNIPSRGRLNAESTALLTDCNLPLVRVKQVMYAPRHRLAVMLQSTVPKLGHNADCARIFRPCHRYCLHEQPHSLLVRELQHMFFLFRSLRLIHLKKGSAPPEKLVSSLASRRRTSQQSTSP